MQGRAGQGKATRHSRVGECKAPRPGRQVRARQGKARR
jgi:hypothetical protein